MKKVRLITYRELVFTIYDNVHTLTYNMFLIESNYIILT